MLKKKILARKVYNLTDARYFAAMGVDWISYDFSGGISNEIIKYYSEIISWIEGPESLAELKTPKLYTEINMLAFSGLVQTDPGFFEEGKQCFLTCSISELLRAPGLYVSYYGNLILEPKKSISEFSKEEKSGLLQIAEKKPFILDISAESKVEEELLDLPGIKGLAFEGGEEEKVGVKTYEELDEWFDLLNE